MRSSNRLCSSGQGGESAGKQVESDSGEHRQFNPPCRSNATVKLGMGCKLGAEPRSVSVDGERLVYENRCDFCRRALPKAGSSPVFRLVFGDQGEEALEHIQGNQVVNRVFNRV